jgi:uncharacterized protein HemY
MEAKVSQSRIDAFESMLKDDPEQPMVWYGLASEYFKLERWADAAGAFRSCIDRNRDYTAAYQMLGTALLNQGEREAARQAWSDGIQVAARTGAWKAGQHMEGLLAGTNEEGEEGFCK